VRLSLDRVEPELARLWEEEARRSQATRVELLTLVALVSEPALLERAQNVVARVARAHPSRTVLATWIPSDTAGITADVALHRASPGGAACGDQITVEATGAGREWLPENADRLALPDLPICVWWVGDLPDYDRLFDRMAVAADLVIVNSDEMDLRDLEKLASVLARVRDRCAMTDLTWIRLRPLQELVARFFDDESARGCMSAIDRITIEFSPREGEKDVASTQAGLLFGWMAHALSLRPEGVHWKRGAGWGEATLGRVVARFVHRPRADVPPGSVLRVTIECDGARFDIERQDDPQVLRWSRETPGSPVPPQTLRVETNEEASLLIRCLERPRRDGLFERSLYVGSRIVRPIAPRLSSLPQGPGT
jgi:glucose-6-phosphate dehydrogenase assembly protein OpcA